MKITYLNNCRKTATLLFALIFSSGFLTAQLTGTKTIPGDYASIAAFVADVNLNGVGAGGVTLDVPAGYSETAPAIGIQLTATGTAANPITIQKSGAGVNPVINAGVGTSTPGSAVQDGVFALIGSDYITIDGIDIADANSTNPATMEFGYGLFKASVTDGCQNNLIKNCTITLSYVNNAGGSGPSFDGSRGINVTNSLITTQTTSVVVTSAAGSNSNNQFYTNTIRNTNIGIALAGFSSTTLADTGNDVGGFAAATGNTILNFGGAASATNPSAGIRTINQYSPNISYNTLNNNNGTGANHVSTLRGIYIGASTSASASINNNTITVVSGSATSLLSGIENASGSTAASNTININNNIIQIAYSTATTATVNGVLNSGTATTVNINGNTITNVATLPAAQNVLGGTGTLVMIEGGSPVNLNMNNNTITAIGRTALSGIWRVIKMTSPTTTTISGNIIENLAWVTPLSTGSIDGIYGLSSSVDVTISNNIVRNLATPTTGTLTGIREYGVAGNKIVSGNQVYGFATTSGGAGGESFNGIHLSVGTITIQNNTIYNLVSTGSSGGTGGTINGIQINTGTIPSVTIKENKLYDLSSTSTGVVVSGINIVSGTITTANIQNNLIGDLRAPAVSGTNAIIGININTGTTVNVYYNTVHLAASSTGANFGTSAISSSTGSTLNLNNNIFSNASTNNGTGLATAYRRSTATLTSYGAGSDRNDFVGSTIYTDGTNTDATFAAYQVRVAPRDANSLNVTPVFTSLVGANAGFLHINTSFPTALESGGANIGGITIDYDNQTRQGNVGYVGTGTAPDLGADEFEIVAVNCSTANGGTISPASASICEGGTRTMTASGATNENGISYQWKVATVAGGPYLNVSGGSGATSTSYTTGPMTAGTFYYIMEITCSFGPVSGASNEFTLVVNPNPTVSVNPTAATYCTPGPGVSLTASGASTYGWSPTLGLSAATGTTVTATPSSTTTYTVLGVDGNGCTASATTTITVANTPVVSSVTATPNAVCDGSNSQLAANASLTYNNTAAAYSFVGSTDVYTPITGTTLGAGINGDDVAIGNLPIGFTFNYNGGAQTVFAAASNGFIELGSALTYANNAGSGWTPSTNSLAGRANIIAPIWDDNNTTGATVIYATTGTAPNRILTVQWTGMHVGSSGSSTNPTIDCQVQLFETTGVIKFIYGPTSAALTGTTASIGISGGVGNYKSVTPLSPANTSTVSSSSENTGISSATNFPSGTVYTFTPPPAPTLTYSWSPATFLSSTTISNPVATAVTSPISYTVTVTSTSGCTNTGNVSLTVNPLPSAVTATNSNQCGTQIPTASVTSTTGEATPTFTWYDAATGGSLLQTNTSTTYLSNVASTITFYVSEVNGITGCESLRTPVTVTVAAADGISASANPTTMCIGGSVTLTAANTNPTPNQNYTYSWSSTVGSGAETPVAGSTVTITPTADGTYTYNLTGVDGLCNAVATTTITVDPFTATLTPIDATCNGIADGSFSLGTTTCGTSPFTYSVDAGTFGAIPTNLNAGTHSVVVKDANGFTTSSISITIGQPSTTITNPTVVNASVCQNDLSAEVSATATTSVLIPASTVINFTVSAQPTEVSSSTVPGSVAASPNAMATATMTSLPAGAVVTGVTFNYNSIQALGNSWQSDVRLGLVGAVAQNYSAGTGSANSAGTFNYVTTIPVGSVNTSGGTITMHYFDYFNDNAGAEATFPTGTNIASITINYNVPTSATVTWWDSPTNGSQIGSGSPFETVGTSVLPNTSTPGVYTVYAQGQNGACPSPGRTATTITVNSPTTSMVMITACDSYTLNSQTYTSSGTYTQLLTNAAGCDSTLTLMLTINNSSASTTTIIACDSYTWTNGTTYTTSGTYTQTLVNAVGCDSVATLALTINNSNSSSQTITACDSYTWSATGLTYTSSGMYMATLTNQAGCDSSAMLMLTINQSNSGSQTTTACDSYTWPATGLSYSASGMYMATLTNQAGCDSTVMLMLTINNSSSSTTTATACDSYTWTNGTTYTSSGTYTQTLVNSVGCDSVATLALTINNSNSSTQTVSACVSYTWSATGLTYTSSGMYTTTLTNQAGCDSTAMLMLTINQPNSGSQTTTACDSYTWSATGTTYTSSGMYMATIPNQYGCDSTVMLMLTINNSSTSTTSVTECYQYTWTNGTTYTTSGTYTQTLTNAVGCDSVATLNLTINNSTTSSTTVTECESYTWTDGITYTASGTYSQILVNSVGCDSIANLVLTINNSTTSTTTVTECESYTWTDGLTYTGTGTFTQLLTNAAGCDSIATLNLSIIGLPTVTATDNGDATITSSSGTIYAWIDCGNNVVIPGQTGQSLIVTANGSYASIVTVNGCSDTSNCVLIDYIGIKEISDELISLYPNPTLDNVTIKMSSASAMVEIRDAQGKLLENTIAENGDVLNLTKYEPGVYFFTVKTDKGTSLHRIVKN